jgi:cytochrome c-type biogenesis protein CcmH/NrfG
MEFSPEKIGPPATGGQGGGASAEPSARTDESGEIGALRKLVAMDPKDADSWDRLGKALFVAQKLDEAIQSFEKSLELKPDVVEVLANLGVTSKSKGDKSRYAKVLEKLSTLDPKTAKELEAYQPAPAK